MDSQARRAYRFAAALLVAGITPAPAQTVSEWAAAERYVSAESGSPYPGKWDADRVPYLRRVMDTCGIDHPSRAVTILASAQSGKSEAVMNAIAATAVTAGLPILIMLPSLDEASKYNRLKLQPMIDATPALKRLVAEAVSRDETGSTTTHKKIVGGGSIIIVNAGSDKALQMVSAAYRVYEEPTGYPADVGGRGDPISQADARGKAYRERGDKSVLVGTPGTKGHCRITQAFELSDQQRIYVPCPHCGSYQVLKTDNLRHSSDKMPHGAYFACLAAGCVIEPIEKAGMLAQHAWIRTFPSDDPANPAPPPFFPAGELVRWAARDAEHRQPGFTWWQAYSPFVPWDDTVAEQLAAAGNPRRLKVLWQQAYGEAWDEQGEAPQAERLFERRQKWPANRIPAGVLFLTGATDVQGARLEWAVYGWDRHLAGHHIAGGIIEGDPNTQAPWIAHDLLLKREYQDAWGRTWPTIVWGIDSGYLSQVVYRYVQRHARHSDLLRALDGRPGWKEPVIGRPKSVDIDWEGRKVGAVLLWPVGTWSLKSELYQKLWQTAEGPSERGEWPKGCMWFGPTCDRNFFDQLTAEYIGEEQNRDGYTQKKWVKPSSRRNEQLDLAVYCLALAHASADELTDVGWAALERERLGPPAEAQLDLASIWAPGLVAGVAAPAEEKREGQPPSEPAASSQTSPQAGPVNPITGRPRGGWL